LFQLGGCFHGRLGILQGHQHIHFQQFQHDILLFNKKVGLGIVESIRNTFEDVALDMVTVLLWVQQLFPYLME